MQNTVMHATKGEVQCALQTYSTASNPDSEGHRKGKPREMTSKSRSEDFQVDCLLKKWRESPEKRIRGYSNQKEL